jgi:hypothetical protein
MTPKSNDKPRYDNHLQTLAESLFIYNVMSIQHILAGSNIWLIRSDCIRMQHASLSNYSMLRELRVMELPCCKGLQSVASAVIG